MGRKGRRGGRWIRGHITRGDWGCTMTFSPCSARLIPGRLRRGGMSVPTSQGLFQRRCLKGMDQGDGSLGRRGALVAGCSQLCCGLPCKGGVAPFEVRGEGRDAFRFLFRAVGSPGWGRRGSGDRRVAVYAGGCKFEVCVLWGRVAMWPGPVLAVEYHGLQRSHVTLQGKTERPLTSPPSMISPAPSSHACPDRRLSRLIHSRHPDTSSNTSSILGTRHQKPPSHRRVPYNPSQPRASNAFIPPRPRSNPPASIAPSFAVHQYPLAAMTPRRPYHPSSSLV